MKNYEETEQEFGAYLKNTIVKDEKFSDQAIEALTKFIYSVPENSNILQVNHLLKQLKNISFGLEEPKNLVQFDQAELAQIQLFSLLLDSQLECTETEYLNRNTYSLLTYKSIITKLPHIDQVVVCNMLMDNTLHTEDKNTIRNDIFSANFDKYSDSGKLLNKLIKTRDAKNNVKIPEYNDPDYFQTNLLSYYIGRLSECDFIIGSDAINPNLLLEHKFITTPSLDNYNSNFYSNVKRGLVYDENFEKFRLDDVLNKISTEARYGYDLSNHNIVVQNAVVSLILKLTKEQKPDKNFQQEIFDLLEDFINQEKNESANNLLKEFQNVRTQIEKGFVADAYNLGSIYDLHGKAESIDGDVGKYLKAYYYFIRVCCEDFRKEEYVRFYKLENIKLFKDVWEYYWDYMKSQKITTEQLKNYLCTIATFDITVCQTMVVNSAFEAAAGIIEGIDIYSGTAVDVVTQEQVVRQTKNLALKALKEMKITDQIELIKSWNFMANLPQPTQLTILQLEIFKKIATQMIDNSKAIFDTPIMPVKAMIYAQKVLQQLSLAEILDKETIEIVSSIDQMLAKELNDLTALIAKNTQKFNIGDAIDQLVQVETKNFADVKLNLKALIDCLQKHGDVKAISTQQGLIKPYILDSLEKDHLLDYFTKPIESLGDKSLSDYYGSDWNNLMVNLPGQNNT